MLRQIGQCSEEEIAERDLLAELEHRESLHQGSKDKQKRIDGFLEPPPPPPKEVEENQVFDDADDTDSSSGDDDDESSSEDEDEEEAELLRELENIKKERELERIRKVLFHFFQFLPFPGAYDCSNVGVSQFSGTRTEGGGRH